MKLSIIGNAFAVAIALTAAAPVVANAASTSAANDPGTIHIGSAATAHGGSAPSGQLWTFRSHWTLRSRTKTIGVIRATGSWVTTSFRTLVHRVTCTTFLKNWRCSANRDFFIGRVGGRPNMRDVHVIGHVLRRIQLKGRINKRNASYCFRISRKHGPVKGSFRACPISYPPFD
jgi:hypothetical protein